jgi:DNA polymerase Ligase (LigD)
MKASEVMTPQVETIRPDIRWEYANFEGVIPKGNSGTGEVIIWELGKYRIDGDPLERLKAGRLELTTWLGPLPASWAGVLLPAYNGTVTNAPRIARPIIHNL